MILFQLTGNENNCNIVFHDALSWKVYLYKIYIKIKSNNLTLGSSIIKQNVPYNFMYLKNQSLDIRDNLIMIKQKKYGKKNYANHYNKIVMDSLWSTASVV